MSTATRKKTPATELVPLSPDEIRHLPKPYKGFEQFAEPLLALYREHEAALSVEGLDVDAIEEAQNAYDALAAPEAEAAKQLELIQATRLMYGSKAWSAYLEIYARGQGAARTNIAIRRAIAGFASFLKHGPRAKKPKPTQ
jgi:hypothetical protein